MKKKLLSLLFLAIPFLTFAQEKGLDEKINDAFMPFATWWEGLVLTTVPIGEYNVPFVVILLVLGATFFTLFFKVAISMAIYFGICRLIRGNSLKEVLN